MDTRTPENTRTSPNRSHDTTEDPAEQYAAYVLSLRLAGLRRAELRREADAGVPGAAEELAREEAEALDRSTLYSQLEPWIRWADVGAYSVPEHVRGIVFRLDGYRCRLCGLETGRLEIDHIVPLSSGGTDHLRNLWVLCRPCNRAKGARPLAALLTRQPTLQVRPSPNRPGHMPCPSRTCDIPPMTSPDSDRRRTPE